jgi:hypothetical protein
MRSTTTEKKRNRKGRRAVTDATLRREEADTQQLSLSVTPSRAGVMAEVEAVAGSGSRSSVRSGCSLPLILSSCFVVLFASTTQRPSYPSRTVNSTLDTSHLPSLFFRVFDFRGRLASSPPLPPSPEQHCTFLTAQRTPATLYTSLTTQTSGGRSGAAEFASAGEMREQRRRNGSSCFLLHWRGCSTPGRTLGGSRCAPSMLSTTFCSTTTSSRLPLPQRTSVQLPSTSHFLSRRLFHRSLRRPLLGQAHLPTVAAYPVHLPSRLRWYDKTASLPLPYRWP